MTFKEQYGPWAVIAGASEGTGRAFARKVASLGLNCILVARRREPLEELQREILAASAVECVIASVDLSASNALEEIKAAVGDREVGLYIANAGADPYGSRFLDKELGAWMSLVSRNVVDLMACCHHFGNLMKSRGRGGMILVGSGACYGGADGLTVYAATKAFDLCFAEGLWAELQPHGVHVLNLILGKTDTPAFRALLADKGAPVPTDLASPDHVAEVGLERLPHGPIHNWGLADDEAGYAISSAAMRRQRTLAISAATRGMFKDRS